MVIEKLQLKKPDELGGYGIFCLIKANMMKLNGRYTA